MCLIAQTRQRLCGENWSHIYDRLNATRGVNELETEETLSSAWDQRLSYEFVAKSPERALAMAAAEPYVNMTPLMIGRQGRSEV